MTRSDASGRVADRDRLRLDVVRFRGTIDPAERPMPHDDAEGDRRPQVGPLYDALGEHGVEAAEHESADRDADHEQRRVEAGGHEIGGQERRSDAPLATYGR